MKRFLKSVYLIMAFLLIAASFAACESTGQTRVQTDGSEFTYWTRLEGDSKNAGITNNSEMMLFQEMEKATGIKINFLHPPAGSSGNEAFTSMLLDEKLPDIIREWWSSYPGGPQQAIDDGVIIALNDYLPKYAPDYWNYVKDGENKKSVTTDQGNYYGFNVLNLGETKGFAGLFVRKDKLDEWGMSIPQTIDDWTALFAKAKSEGIEYPFVGELDCFTFTSDSHSFNTAYDVGQGFYVDDVNGKTQIVFAPFEKAYADYLAQLQAWFEAGYIDPDFGTIQRDSLQQKMVEGKSIATFGYVGSGIGKILPAAQKKNPKFDLVACPYPSTKDGHESEFQQCYNPATDHANAITWQCGNYEKAVEWCNYVYSEEGMVLQLFGKEGVHHTVEVDENGEKHYKYTDLITEPKKSDCNSVTEAMYKYMLPCNTPGYNQHIDYLNGYYTTKQQKDAIKVWNVSANKDGTADDNEKLTDTPQEHKLPTLSYTSEESSRMAELFTHVENKLEASLIDVIMGKKTIDDWNKDIETAKKNGYDEIIKIQNAAYARYLKK